jgi:hypothetical protein
LIPEKPVRNFLPGQGVFVDRGYPGNRMPPLYDNIILALLNFFYHFGKIIYCAAKINIHGKYSQKYPRFPEKLLP